MSMSASFEPVRMQHVSLADGLCVQVAGKGSVYLPCLAKSMDMICAPTLKYKPPLSGSPGEGQFQSNF